MQRRVHCACDVLAERVGIAEDAVEQAALVQRADDVRERGRWLTPDDGKLGDPVALHELDGGADLLVRFADDEVGGGAVLGVLEGEHFVDRRQRAAPLQQPVLEHPVVVEDLRQVAASAVGDGREDRLARAVPSRRLEHREHRRAGRAAAENALLAREAAGGEERVAVGHAHVLVDDRRVERLGERVLADALDEIRVDVALVLCGEDRSLRVGADDDEIGLLFLEVARQRR